MVKKILLWGLLVLLVIALALGGFIAHEWNAKPVFVNNFFNRLALKIALNSPETLSSLHFLEPIGINGHNAELDDASPRSTDEFFKYIASERNILASYDDSSLSEAELMSKRVANYLFGIAKEAEPFKFHNYPVNQLFGVQNEFPTFMESQHQINDAEEAEFYIQRLKKLPRKFSQVLEGLKLRTENGIIPPKFVIARVIKEMTKFTDTDVEKNILYQSFDTKLSQLKGLNATERQSLLNRSKEAIVNDVYPAYVELTRYFEGLADKATNEDGFWKLPDGDKAYRLALKFFTTTDYTPITFIMLD